MNRVHVARSGDRHQLDAGPEFALPWLSSAVAAALGAAILAFVPWRAILGPWGAALSIHVSAAAAGLLALAAALYLSLDVRSAAGLGRRAAQLALAGAWLLLVASAVRAVDAAWPALALPAGFAVAYEAPSWTAALAVLACLRIDQTWHTHRAGAVVLPLVVVALMLDMWLIGSTPSMPGLMAEVLRVQLGWGWHVGGKLGVAACVVLTGWSFAARRALERGADAWLRGAMVLGFVGFTLALVCAAALLLLPGTSSAATRRFGAGAAVWLGFVMPFVLWRRGRGWREGLAPWVLLGIGLATSGYVLVRAPQALP